MARLSALLGGDSEPRRRPDALVFGGVDSLLELRDGGFTAQELRDAECTARELSDAKYTAVQLREAGYSLQDLCNAGLTKSV